MEKDNSIYISMIQPRGRAHRSDRLAEKSHYNDPIDNSPGRAADHSRIWGGASPETQSRAIDTLIVSGERADLNPHQIAYVLTIARVESGFNPDASYHCRSSEAIRQWQCRPHTRE